MAPSSLDQPLSADPSRSTEHPGAIRTLVEQMAAANPLWGAPRIHGELGKLGIEVSERTVSRLLRQRRRPPLQTWRTFLTNHVCALVSMDFFTVPTLTGRVRFVRVLLAHHRRRIVHLAVTEPPTAIWTAQQIIEAFPDDGAPKWLLSDRDAIYGDLFRRRVASMGISEVISSPSSPWQNPYAPRDRVPGSRRFAPSGRTTRSLTRRRHPRRVPVERNRRAGERGTSASLLPLYDRDPPQATSARNSRNEPRTAAQRGFGEGQCSGGTRRPADRPHRDAT